MTTPSFKTAEALDAAWFAPAGGALATVGAKASSIDAAGAPQDAKPSTPARGRVFSRVLRVVRDLALGLSLVAAIPLAVIGVTGHNWGWNSESVRDRLVEVERVRPLTAPLDATISPEVAGAAMRRLVPTTGTPTFPVPNDRIHDEPWDAALAPDLFPSMRSNWWNGPEPTKIVTAAANGFSPREREWLKGIAESPIWQDVDLVARANRVDVLGQRFQMPFTEDAWSAAMPIPSLMRSRKLASAGVARAAYYVSIGDYARAESALRTIVSFGFASLDDGITTIEGLIGRVVIDAGRNGLQQLYTLDGRDEMRSLAAPFASRVARDNGRPADRSAATIRDAALRNVNDPSLPRSFRYEQLSMAAWSTCGSVNSVLLGPADEVQQAFDVARRSLAQTEAERRYIDMLERNVSAMPVRPVPPNLLLEIVQGAAVVTSTVTGNPRIASCTRMAIGDFTNR